MNDLGQIYNKELKQIENDIARKRYEEECYVFMICAGGDIEKIFHPELYDIDGTYEEIKSKIENKESGDCHLYIIAENKDKKSMMYYDFVDSSLTELTIPEGVTKLSTDLFDELEDIKRIRLSGSITSIDEEVWKKIEEAGDDVTLEIHKETLARNYEDIVGDSSHIRHFDITGFNKEISEYLEECKKFDFIMCKQSDDLDYIAEQSALDGKDVSEDLSKKTREIIETNEQYSKFLERSNANIFSTLDEADKQIVYKVTNSFCENAIRFNEKQNEFIKSASDANLFNKDIAAISESLSNSYNAFVNLQNEIMPEIKDTTLHYLVEEDNEDDFVPEFI